jgi:hypothetical protein
MKIEQPPQLGSCQYAPLKYPDSIRLISLHSGEGASEIQISLREVRSRDEPEYEALSYTWATEDGDTALSSTVYCEGAPIQVTKNCEDALRRLRNRDGERILWVDAICINQADDKERGHQVSQMRDIYSKATQVLIWLGSASDDIDETSGLPVSGMFMEYIGSMAAEVRRYEFPIEDSRNDSHSSPLYRELLSQGYEGVLTGRHGPLYRGFQNITSRSWWGRIWVIQEAAVAKSAILICSEHTADYYDFYTLYRLLEVDSNSQANFAWNTFTQPRRHLGCMHLAKLPANLKNRLSIVFEVLSSVRLLEASDPRDIIFGILGVSETFKSTLPSPDYCKTPTEIYTQVTEAFLSGSQSLDILNSASGEDSALELPSWVSDWSRPPIVFVPSMGDEFYYNAARSSESTCEISSDGKELNILGKEVDCVEKISLADLGTYAFDCPRWERLQGWETSCILASSLTQYPTKETVKEALWRTLCWNIDIDYGYPAPPPGAHFEELYRILMSQKDARSKEKEMNRLPIFIRNNSPLCITSKGFLASVPYTTEVGDCIAVLAGGRVPFVLRRTADYYRLIGPCYVHGIMEGEAFPENISELEWFSIR